jgi:glucose-1-phosphate cytidylyltransferase
MTGKWAIVLCGGRGSRLGSITETIPKPLVLVHGKPIIWYSFLSLYKHGFRNFIFPVGYRGDMVRKYIYETFGAMDCEIFCIDTGEDTSIAGRMAQIVDLIPDKEDFFLINSDTLFDFDIGAMYDQHKKDNALLTLSSVEVVSSWGLIYIWEGKMVDFDRERKIRYVSAEGAPGEYGLINSGLAFLNKEALEWVDLNEVGLNFENILYQTIIRIGRASLFEIKGMWFPIDTPKDLDIVNMVVPDINGVGKEAQTMKQNLEVI